MWNSYSSGVTLNRSLISGNSASTGAELYKILGDPITANNYNVIGYGGYSRSFGFTPGANDIIPSGPLITALDPILADHCGSTLTHALVSGSVAIDAAPDGDCSVAPINGLDQRGYICNVDGDGNPSVNECDAGAFEFGAGNNPTPTPIVTTTPTLAVTATAIGSPTPIVTATPTSTNHPGTRPTRTPTALPRPTRTPMPKNGSENALTHSSHEMDANPLMTPIIVALLAFGNFAFFKKWRR
jgi:hypothetical protein